MRTFKFGRRLHKYGAKPIEIDGIRFSSKAEGHRYQMLKIMQAAGKIRDLKLQPKFLLQGKFKHLEKTIREINYIADFSYIDAKGVKVIEVVKGMKTK